jgi:hypothetical protein
VQVDGGWIPPADLLSGPFWRVLVMCLVRFSIVTSITSAQIIRGFLQYLHVNAEIVSQRLQTEFEARTVPSEHLEAPMLHYLPLKTDVINMGNLTSL